MDKEKKELLLKIEHMKRLGINPNVIIGMNNDYETILLTYENMNRRMTEYKRKMDILK